MNRIDHTNLKPTITLNSIFTLCQEAEIHGFRGVCVPPNRVKQARDILNKHYLVSTVIGFPLGFNRTLIKLHESKRAVDDGADELDVVWNLGAFLEGNYNTVRDELAQIVKQVHVPIKVIVEVSYIPKPMLIDALRTVCESGAFAIKTSTGMAPRVDLPPIIKLWKDQKKDIKIKASGGIYTYSDYSASIKAGADIIGTSHGTTIFNERFQ